MPDTRLGRFHTHEHEVEMSVPRQAATAGEREMLKKQLDVTRGLFMYIRERAIADAQRWTVCLSPRNNNTSTWRFHSVATESPVL